VYKLTDSDGVGAECAPAFWNAALPTVRDCVTDFETAKSRRGVQACPQNYCKLFNEFLPLDPPANIRRGAR
jgi:hypothetical protein